MNTKKRKTPAAHICVRSRIGTGNRLCIRDGNSNLFHFKAGFPHLFKSWTQKTNKQKPYCHGDSELKDVALSRNSSSVSGLLSTTKKKCRPGHFRCTNPHDCLHLGFSNCAVIKFSNVSVERTASLFRVIKLVQLNSTATQMVGWLGECWIENNVEGRGRALVDVLSRNLHGGTGDSHVGAEIHSGYLPENQFETISLQPACFAKYECSNERVSNNV